MKVSDWIAENKTLIFIPLLALFVAVVIVLAYPDSGSKKATDRAAAPSYPAPMIKTADEPADSKTPVT